MAELAAVAKLAAGTAMAAAMTASGWAPLVLLALLMAAGWPVARRLAAGAAERWSLAGVAGAVALHLVLTAAAALGSPWSRAWVVTPLLLVAGAGAVAHWRWRAPPPAGTAGFAFGWGDALAILAVATLAALAWTRWIAVSDFVYHWGLKGHRFFLDRGIDYAYLARPWNWVIHPDYPNLLPEIYASTALLAGRWSEPPMLVWTAVFVALLLPAAREVLRGGELPPLARQAALATVALALAAFGIGYHMAGAADWLIAVAFLVAVPPLLRPADAAGDLQIGLCAAFGAASKLEGLTLAAWLLLVQLLRRRPWQWRAAVPAALRLGVPVAVVTLPWAYQVIRHSLFQPFNTGTPELSRALVAAAAVLESVTVTQWLGLQAALLLLPLLLRRRRLRVPALVATLQLLTYLWQYVTAPLDTELLVLSTFPRLLLHLLPVVLVLAAVAWLGEEPAEEPAEEPLREQDESAQDRAPPTTGSP